MRERERGSAERAHGERSSKEWYREREKGKERNWKR